MSRSSMPFTTVHCPFQLRVRAFDNGVPPRDITTSVTIEVNRNLACPEWRQQTQTLTIMETLNIATSVGKVMATDKDRQVCEGEPV